MTDSRQFGSSLGFVKDQMPAPDLASASAQVEEYLDTILTGLGRAMQLLTANIFDTPETLLSLINNGAYWQSQGTGKLKVDSAFDVSLRIQQVIWASALPMVWCKNAHSSPF